MTRNYTDTAQLSAQITDVCDQLTSMAQARRDALERHADSESPDVLRYTVPTNRGIVQAYEDCVNHLESVLAGHFEDDTATALRAAHVTFDELAVENKEKASLEHVSGRNEHSIRGAHLGYQTASKLLVDAIDVVEQTDE